MTTFFDPILGENLFNEALILQYPSKVLYMSLQIHWTARVVTANGLHEPDPVDVSNSIMAGFVDSVALTRVLTHRAIARVRVYKPKSETWNLC